MTAWRSGLSHHPTQTELRRIATSICWTVSRTFTRVKCHENQNPMTRELKIEPEDDKPRKYTSVSLSAGGGGSLCSYTVEYRFDGYKYTVVNRGTDKDYILGT